MIDDATIKIIINALVTGVVIAILGFVIYIFRLGWKKYIRKTAGVDDAQQGCPDHLCKEAQMRDQEEFKEALRTEMSDGFDKLGVKMEEGFIRVHNRIDIHLNKTTKEAPTI